jgi:LacI family transcriptional regulator
MADLGFVRNESARQLRAGRSRTLGLVVLDVANPFFTDVARGAEAVAEAKGIVVTLYNSGSDPEREHRHLELLTEQRVQGVLITPVESGARDLDDLAARGIPTVLVDRGSGRRKQCSVAVDDVLGGKLAIEHLVDRGHTQVAYVGGPAHLGQVRDRLQGAREAWAAADLPADALTWIETSALTVAEGREAGARLAGIPTSRRPAAAFCANDLVALGLLQHAISSGVRVPQDLSIVGYDDIEFAAAAAVPLTSVRQPRQLLGRTAAELVLDEATNAAHTHRQVLFTPELVARASTQG